MVAVLLRAVLAEAADAREGVTEVAPAGVAGEDAAEAAHGEVAEVGDLEALIARAAGRAGVVDVGRLLEQRVHERGEAGVLRDEPVAHVRGGLLGVGLDLVLRELAAGVRRCRGHEGLHQGAEQRAVLVVERGGDVELDRDLVGVVVDDGGGVGDDRRGVRARDLVGVDEHRDGGEITGELHLDAVHDVAAVAVDGLAGLDGDAGRDVSAGGLQGELAGVVVHRIASSSLRLGASRLCERVFSCVHTK